MSAVPARRVLFDHPQRLGFLPTLWFWNDRGRQRLMAPLIVALAVPVTVLSFLLIAWSRLPVWILLVVGTLWPQLVLGLVERRIRRELRRRALDEGPHARGAVPLEPRRSSEGVFVVLAGCGALASSVAVAVAWGAVSAFLLALALAVVLAAAWAGWARSSQLSAGVHAGQALAEPPRANTERDADCCVTRDDA